MVGTILAVAHGVQRAGENPVRPVPAEVVTVISAERARRHVDTLASDAMKGRQTPSPELDSAAAYIAGEFRQAGVEPVDGSYFQQYSLKIERLGEQNTLAINGRSFRLKDHFIPSDFTGSGSASAPIVFVGYGISRPEIGYDDYAGMDVRGKVVLAIAGQPEPPAADLPDSAATEWIPFFTHPIEKMRQAARHGAAGFLLLANPLTSRILRPVGGVWPSLYPRMSENLLPLQLDLPDTARRRIPSAGIGAEVAREIFGGTLDRIARLVRRIDTSGRPASTELTSRADLEVHLSTKFIPARNVVGIVRGSTRPDEYVVIGAHYDHVGVASSNPTRSGRNQDTIFNGADDNASGTAGLMMIAEAFAALPRSKRPARSILLVAFSGEEEGLFGSRAFVAHPSVSVDRMVAMLNMDMIGRNTPDSVAVGGTESSPRFDRLVTEANRAEPFAITYDVQDYFYRSDQASFARARVPVLFFYTGEHADYHQVTDAPGRVDERKLAHVARFCFRTAWMLAEMPERPEFQEPRDVRAPELLVDP
jgi:hypothetical protein